MKVIVENFFNQEIKYYERKIKNGKTKLKEKIRLETDTELEKRIIDYATTNNLICISRTKLYSTHYKENGLNFKDIVLLNWNKCIKACDYIIAIFVDNNFKFNKSYNIMERIHEMSYNSINFKTTKLFNINIQKELELLLSQSLAFLEIKIELDAYDYKLIVRWQ